MVYSVILSPLDEEETFDVEPIERYLAYKNDVLLDPAGTDTYLVCGLPEAKKGYHQARLADPSQFPYVVLITVSPDEVVVAQEFGDEDELRSARDFVRWMVENHRVRIVDDMGNEWTERVAKEGANILYPPNVARLP